jgi:hypothetical protein
MKLEQMANVFVLIFLNGLFHYHLHRLHSLAKWKERHAENLSKWIAVTTQFELYTSFASYTENHPDFSWPSISADLDFTTALTKALRELWHDYSFLYVAGTSADEMQSLEGTQYSIKHLADNRLDIKDDFPFNFTQNYDVTLKNYHDLLSYNKSQLYHRLSDISSEIYYYLDYKQDVYFARILSPDFFGHMDVTQPHDLSCAYAQYIQLDKTKIYRKRIPFP